MIIAHDLGTTGNKASLHDDDARLRASVTVPYPANFASGGIAEQPGVCSPSLGPIRPRSPGWSSAVK